MGWEEAFQHRLLKESKIIKTKELTKEEEK